MKISDMCSTEGRLGAYLNTMVSDLEIDGKGQYLRDLFGKFYIEVCAAEEDGKLAKQTTNTQIMPCQEDGCNEVAVVHQCAKHYFEAAL
jgi:hypothetical protein